MMIAVRITVDLEYVVSTQQVPSRRMSRRLSTPACRRSPCGGYRSLRPVRRPAPRPLSADTVAARLHAYSRRHVTLAGMSAAVAATLREGGVSGAPADGAVRTGVRGPDNASLPAHCRNVVV